MLGGVSVGIGGFALCTSFKLEPLSRHPEPTSSPGEGSQRTPDPDSNLIYLFE